MATYSPTGKGAKALTLLATGPATLEQIRDDSGACGAKRKKYWHTITALLADGLVARLDGEYVITLLGLEALDDLRAGRPYTFAPAPVPNIRVFVGVAA